MSKTKDPRDNGCLCQRCGRGYKVDFRVDDELWERIRGGYSLLCGRCIAETIEALNEFGYYDVKIPLTAEIER